MSGIMHLLSTIERIILTLENMRKVAYFEHGKWLLKQKPLLYNVFSHYDKFSSVAIEMLYAYLEKWRNPVDQPNVHDMEERVKIVIGSCFVSFVSATEHFMKNSLKRIKAGPLHQWYSDRTSNNKRVFFGGILKHSKEHNLISESEHYAWTGIRWLRNALVHNNAIADFTEERNIDGVSVKFRESKPIRYPLWGNASFCSSVEKLTYEWCRKFLKLHRIGP